MMADVVQFVRFFKGTAFSTLLIFVCLALRMAHAQNLNAQDSLTAESESAGDASKQAANPLSNLWLMQVQQNTNWIGMPAKNGNRVQSDLQFQPLMSVKMNDDWNLITRPVLQLFNSTPFLDQAGQEKRTTAFGDTVLALALSPSHKLVGNWLLAAGPSFIFPTATNSLIGQNKWQVGPAAALGYQGKDFITYVFPQQWFSVGGDGRKISHMLLYYAFVKVYSNGWTVGTNPAMSVDWEAASGNKVAFPVGLQIGKLRKLGPLPVKFDLQAQYYAVRPQVYGPKWNLQLQITPILPSLIRRK